MRVKDGVSSSLTTSPSASLSLSADHIFSLERCHPAGHRLHGGQPELQARERCVDAGLLRGGEHLFPQVSTTTTNILYTWSTHMDNMILSMLTCCMSSRSVCCSFERNANLMCSYIFFRISVKAATSLQPTISQTSDLKHTLPWPSATSENCLASGRMTTW